MTLSRPIQLSNISVGNASGAIPICPKHRLEVLGDLRWGLQTRMNWFANNLLFSDKRYDATQIYDFYLDDQNIIFTPRNGSPKIAFNVTGTDLEPLAASTVAKANRIIQSHFTRDSKADSARADYPLAERTTISDPSALPKDKKDMIVALLKQGNALIQLGDALQGRNIQTVRKQQADLLKLQLEIHQLQAASTAFDSPLLSDLSQLSISLSKQHDKLGDLVKDKRKTNKLHRQVNGLKQKLQQAEQSRDKAFRELGTEVEKHTELRREYHSLKSKEKALHKKLHGSKEEARVAKQQLKQARAQFAQKLTQAQSQNQQLSAQLQIHAHQYSQALQQLDRLAQKQQSTSAELTSAHQRIQQLETYKAMAEEVRVQNFSAMQKLAAERDQAVLMVHSFAQKLEEGSQERRRLESQLALAHQAHEKVAQQKETIHELRQELIQAEEQSSDYLATCDRLLEANVNLKNSEGELRLTIKALEMEVAALKFENEGLRSNHRDILNALQTALDKQRDLEQENARLQKKLEDQVELKRKLQAAKKQVEILRKQNSALQTKTDELERLNAKFKAENGDKAQLIQTQLDEISRLQARISQLDSTVGSTKSKTHAEVTQAQRELQQTRERLDSKITQLNKTILDLEASSQAKDRSIAAQAHQIRDKNAEIQKLRAENEALKKANALLTKEIAQANTKAQQQAAEIEKLKVFESQVKTLESRIAELEKRPDPSEFDRIKAELIELQTKQAALEQAVSNAKLEADNLRAEAEKLRSRIRTDADLQSQLEKANAKAKKAEDAADALRSDLERVNSQLRSYSLHAIEDGQRVKELQDRISLLEAQLAAQAKTQQAASTAGLTPAQRDLRDTMQLDAQHSSEEDLVDITVDGQTMTFREDELPASLRDGYQKPKPGFLSNLAGAFTGALGSLRS